LSLCSPDLISGI